MKQQFCSNSLLSPFVRKWRATESSLRMAARKSTAHPSSKEHREYIIDIHICVDIQSLHARGELQCHQLTWTAHTLQIFTIIVAAFLVGIAEHTIRFVHVLKKNSTWLASCHPFDLKYRETLNIASAFSLCSSVSACLSGCHLRAIFRYPFLISDSPAF